MGFFDNKEEELEKEVARLKYENERLKFAQEENAKLKEKLFELKANIQKEVDAARISAMKAAQDSLDKAGAIRATHGQIAILVRVVGLLFIATSIVFGYLLGTRQKFSFDIRVAWVIYLFCQFSGLYLAGYGRELTLKALQFFGLYLTALFLIVSAGMILSLLNIINLQITANIVALAAVNSIGIAVLVHVEKEIFRIHKGEA